MFEAVIQCWNSIMEAISVFFANLGLTPEYLQGVWEKIQEVIATILA